MRKLALFVLTLAISLGVSLPSVYAAVCDQTFNGGHLRYKMSYPFYDTLHNNTSSTTYVSETSVNYTENGTWNTGASSTWSYFDPGSDFQYTQALINSGYGVPANSSMRIIETGPTNWKINNKPAVRTNGTAQSYDFALRYNVSYDKSNNWPDLSDDTLHTECIYYSVSWCGDGVRDPGFERCDPNDPGQNNWGNGGCTNMCEPIVVDPVTTCDGLTVSPNSGTAPFTTNVSCTGTNVNTYQITCGNGETINGQTGTCSYDQGGPYNLQCSVTDADGNSNTSNACRETITVQDTRNPLITIDKRDANPADLDNGMVDSQTVVTGEKAVFKIRVTNVGNEALRNIIITDEVEPNCAGSVTLPNSKPSTWSNFRTGGQGNHNNTILDVGEWFEYTCEKSNTQANYENEATVRSTGVTSGIPATDVDDTKVQVINPEITVIKTDANGADLDTIEGNDTQTVRTGDSAVFRITVRNTGTEDLENITLSDPQAAACATKAGTVVNLAGKVFTSGTNAQRDISVSGLGNHNDAIFQVGEVFTYTCARGNTQADYTNVVEVGGTGVTSGVTVNDDDTSVVVVDDTPTPVYDLALRKTLQTTGELMRGDDVVFRIEVFNQGNVDATNIEVTDYIPAGLILNDNAWSQTGASSSSSSSGGGSQAVTRTIASIPAGQSQPLTITLTIADNAPRALTNIAEISSDNGDDCDSTPDGSRNNDGTPVDNNIGNGCNPGGDEDDHDPETIILVDTVYDLALRKILVTDPTTLVRGGRVQFRIEVTNQGNVDATNIEVTDYIPEGLTLANENWVQSGDVATIEIASIPAGETVPRGITFTIDTDAPNRINNFAEISRDDGDDCDSTPDGINGNQDGETESTGMVNDNIGNGCNPGGDEDDHDIEPITIPDPIVPSIIIDKRDANSDFDQDGSIGGNDSQTVNQGDKAVFKIRVTNNGNEDLTDIVLTDALAPNCAGSVTLPNDFPSTFIGFTINGSSQGSASNNILEPGEYFEYTCEKTNTQADYVNSATVDAKGVNTGTGVDSTDTTPVIVVPDVIYDLALRKTLVNTSSSFSVGDDVTFQIEVFNQGNVDASNIEVTDYIPTGLILNDTAWTATTGKATQRIPSIAAGESKKINITFTVAANAPSTITNFAEISEDDGQDCDSTPDGINRNQDGENGATGIRNDDIGDGCNPGGDEDDHDLERITVDTPVFDLALKKLLVSNKNTFQSGDRVQFRIEVTNQGNIDATNVEITDYIPAGLTLANANWVQTGNVATREITSIPAGEMRPVGITFTIDADAPMRITNFAEISNDNSGDFEDCDSTPDGINSNQDGETSATGMRNNQIGNGCEPGGDEDDHDFERIVVVKPEPSIVIDKRDANSADLDGNIGGNDSQIVNTGNRAVFKIRVTNDGNEDLTDIVLTDALAPNCAGPITLPDDFPSTWSNLRIAGAGNHNDRILQPGEYFEYTCEKANTQADYVNSATVDAKGVNTGTGVDSTDTTPVIVVVEGPSIVIDKTDANTTTIDQDGVIGNDTQTVNVGDTAVFKIRVTNNGSEDLNTIVLTDALAPNCAGSVTLPSTVPATWSNFVVAGLGNRNDAALQPGEYFEYTCEKANTQAGYTNSATVDAKGVSTGTDVDSTDTTPVLIPGVTGPSIVIDKTDANTTTIDQDGVIGNDTQTVNVGDTAVFKIRVTNNGSEDLNTIVLTDALAPNCAGSVTLPSTVPATWSNFVVAGLGNHNDAALQPGEYFEYTCEKANTQAGYTNSATVDAKGVNTGTDVDSTDTTPVLIAGDPVVCNTLTATPATARNSLTSELSCVGGAGVTSYKIEVKNNAGTVVETLNSATGSVTLNTVGTYTASCFVNNQTTTPNSCTKTLRVTSGSSSSGGTPPRCTQLTRTILVGSPTTITCQGNNRASAMYLNCGGTNIGPKSATQNSVTGAYTAVFECSADAVQCYVDNNISTPLDDRGTNGWQTSSVCREGGGSSSSSSSTSSSSSSSTSGSSSGGGICGDSIIQPNRPGSPEQCDLGGDNGGTDADGNPYACDAQCNIISCLNDDTCVETWPNEGEITFGPVGTVIVGHGKYPLGEFNYGAPFIRNDSDYDLSFDKLCVQRNNEVSYASDDSVGTNRECKPLKDLVGGNSDNVIYPGETISFPVNINDTKFKTDKSEIPDSAEYGRGRITTSVEDSKTNGTPIDYKNAYFAGHLDVRVARPAIATVGGGTSYVKNTNESTGEKVTGDIYDTTIGVNGVDATNNTNKNFVGTSASDDTLSSYSEELDETNDADAVNVIVDDKEKIEVKKVEDVLNTTATTTMTNYNGLANVFIVKGDYTLSSTDISKISTLTEPRTYIIESGNLTIPSNISAGKNVAFVVRGGDIIVDKNATSIDGTYIAIGGDIKSNGPTNKQLVVNGSLYGNVENLVKNRHYISQDTSSNQLSVGTIVSFGSGIFHKPAPLVSQFIGEYLDSEKVAR